MGPIQYSQGLADASGLRPKTHFPPEIVTSTLRPDLIRWSNSSQLAYIIEWMVPWEDSIEEAYQCKKLRYAKLAEAEDRV